MIIVGIESSCDETAIAVVENGFNVRSSLISSQVDTHKIFGGVVPEIAAREHLKIIRNLYHEAINNAGISPEDIDAIAVTQGPGLIGALLVGVSFAKGLACSLQKPLIPVDHVHAHIHGAFLGIKKASVQFPDIFPCLALVVSGGHTNLYIMNNPIHFSLIAATADDACGECFDKVAKIMGLNYPGGPQIEMLAENGDPKALAVPTMVAEKQKMMFSYSGLKTHMVNYLKQKGSLSEQELSDACAAFQEEALGQLVRKVKEAIMVSSQPIRSFVVAGGVAANQRFRALVKEHIEVDSFFPELTYCSDNAAMIAGLGWHVFQRSAQKNKFSNDSSWDAYSRYRFEQVFQPEN